MTERYSISELRRMAKRDAAMQEYDGYPEQVLALVSAVEAAHSFVHGTYRSSRETIDTSAHGELLRNALDRFDGFGASE